MVQPHQHGMASGPSDCRTGYRSLQDQRPFRAVTTVAHHEQPGVATDRRSRPPGGATGHRHGPGHPHYHAPRDQPLRRGPPERDTAQRQPTRLHRRPVRLLLLINADDRPVVALRVEADGPWTIKTASPAVALSLDGLARRPASDVLRYEGGLAITNLSYEDDPHSPDGGYFLVDIFEPDSHGFLAELANHVGPRQGEAPPPDPCPVFARSDGPWSINVRPLPTHAR